MAKLLDQFQALQTTFDQLVIAVEDVSGLWLEVKDALQGRLPLKNVTLNNKTRNSVIVEKLSAEFILTTDPRLLSEYSEDQQPLFWFHEPYATVILMTCEDLDEYKGKIKPQLKLVAPNDDNEWMIIFVNKVDPKDDPANKLIKKVYAKMEVEFNTKKRERCCKLDLHGLEAHFWEDFEFKILECIRNTLDKRIQFYDDEIRKLNEQRYMPVLNFCLFFILKESMAFMFDVTHLHEDSLREYVELEQCYLEKVNMSGKHKYFGGGDDGDDQAAFLRTESKALQEIVQDDSFREFEFRQYLFARQAKLLVKLDRSFDLASNGYSFIINFSKILESKESLLPFCMREVWVITACLALINVTTSQYQVGHVEADVGKEFYRLQGDLYSLCRVKFMRLAYLLGYGPEIERSPANSAALSVLPWPKPANWPLVPPNASCEVLKKEKMILQASPRAKHLGVQRKFLPLEPSVLLHEANKRRGSMSVGNMTEMLDGEPDFDSCSQAHASIGTNPQKETVASMSRANSTPNFEAFVDRPMKLAEIHVAAEHALKKTMSDPELWKSLSSIEEFEKKYLELTKGAAGNYHRSWRKRHGVTLEGEIGVVYHKHGNYDLASRSYEKVCALYASEGWEDLLIEVLPSLAECQKMLNDEAGYLKSCVKLLSLDKGLFLTEERKKFQAEVVHLAHSEMKNPVPLYVSSLITFSGNPRRPLELCDGDPGELSIIIWSGFPDDLTVEMLQLTLVDTHHADEGAKAASASAVTVLNSGRNVVSLSLPPQKPGSYILGVLTGQIGNLRFRSHSVSKGSPTESDDFMSYEKPARPILKVSRPRALVDLTPAVSSGLLINEPQWIGIVVRPINYSLKGGILSLDPGPGLIIEGSYPIEIDEYTNPDPSSPSTLETHSNDDADDEGAFLNVHTSPSSTREEKDAIEMKACGKEAPSTPKMKQLSLQDGKVRLPEWASYITSVLWIPVRAITDGIPRAGSQRLSIVEGLRTMALKLDFGIAQNQTFESTLAVHFTEPLDVSTRVIDICSGTFLLQITLRPQVKAILSIHDAWLDLQDGFMNTCHNGGRPISAFFPLTVSPSSRAGMLFRLCFRVTSSGEEAMQRKPESLLHISYRISGNRNVGAHEPVSMEASTNAEERKQDMTFKIALALQESVLDPCLAVGFLPFPRNGLRVGQLITVNWRIERLKDSDHNAVAPPNEVVLYEVGANSENWMLAGRKRGHISLSTTKGTRIVVSVLCVPLVAGYVQPPYLGLPEVDQTNIRCSPPAPHLVCVLPPVLSSSYCIPT